MTDLIVRNSHWLDVAYSYGGVKPPFTLHSFNVEVVRSKAFLNYIPSPVGSYTKEFRTSWKLLGYGSATFASQWRTAVRSVGYVSHVLGSRVPNRKSPIPMTKSHTAITVMYKLASSSSPIPAFLSPPVASVKPMEHVYGEIYNRLWVIPPSLTFLNPVLGSFTLFELWSAWNVKNTISSVTVTGTPAIATDLTTPYLFDASGSKHVKAIISSDSYNDIDTVLVFNVDHGENKTLRVTAQILLFDRKIPDVTIEEQYNWMTNIITSFNGTEQRIAIRGAPRRIVNAEFTLEDDDQLRRFQELIYRGNNTSIGIPMWQYASALQLDVNVGQNSFSLDTEMTDIRVGDSFLAVDLQDDSKFEIFTVEAVFADHVTTLVNATHQFKKFQTVLIPVMAGKIQDSSTIRFDTTFGETSLTVEENTGREVTARPFTPGNLVSYYDSLPVLDRVPLNTANEFAVINNAELIDYDVGKSAKKMSWTNPKKAISRQYVVNRYQQNNEMDYWKELLTALNGSQKAFLMPTQNRDIEIDPASVNVFNNIVIEGRFYGESLFSQDSHKRIIVHTNEGPYYRKVSSISFHPTEKKTILTLDVSLPPTITFIEYIEFLLKVRIHDDQVTLSHDVGETILSVNCITTDQS